MDVILILALILFNGFFAMAEIAIVSSRKSRLKNLATSGSRNGKMALNLAEAPNTFLSSVQIGITLVTVLAGAVGEGRFASRVGNIIKPLPIIGQFYEEIAFVIIITTITYLSIILGELVPKRIALSNPEKIASLVAPFMSAFASFTSPIIKILSSSTEFVFKLIGLKSAVASSITEEEIRILIREGADMGIFSKTEKKLIERALRLDDLRIGLLMTPKHRMSVINIEKFIEKPDYYLSNYHHSRIIFTEGKQDKIFGVVHIKDLLSYYLKDGSFEADKLKEIIKKPHLVPESMKTIKVLEMFRHSPIHIALVLDEFGTIQGLVTFNDILEALVGEIKSQTVQDPLITVRENGSFLIDGMTSLYDLRKELHLDDLTNKDLSIFQTAAGFFIAHLEKIPKTGEYFEKYGYRFEVVDMDHNRIDKILVKKIT